MRKVDPAERTRRTREVAESLGIGAYLNRRPAELSGGQRQRVALARAIVREPKVFLFDEPLSNLDAQVRSSTRAELVRLHQSLGATMIHVTHDQVEAMSMAQRVAVMNSGRIEHCAPPLDVYRSPDTLFTATFLGSPSINQWQGEVRASGSGMHQKFHGSVSLDVHMPPDTDVTLAVRPEHLRFDVVESGGNATVTRIESLGAETLIHATASNDEQICSRVVAGAVAPVGSKVRCVIDAKHALLFDRTGRLAGRGRT
jgi:multiple sugar transport system ATP-binding protein